MLYLKLSRVFHHGNIYILLYSQIFKIKGIYVLWHNLLLKCSKLIRFIIVVRLNIHIHKLYLYFKGFVNNKLFIKKFNFLNRLQ